MSQMIKDREQFKMRSFFSCSRLPSSLSSSFLLSVSLLSTFLYSSLPSFICISPEFLGWRVLIGSTANKLHILQAGGVNVIVEAMRLHPHHPRVQDTACGALANFTADSGPFLLNDILLATYYLSIPLHDNHA
jgi:hypothetical protein